MRKAFTLIELLVVVSIIVILLAILAPAITKALYQAELAACAANMDGVATGAIQYAMSNNRRYPERKALRLYTGYVNDEVWALRWTTVRGVLQMSDGAQKADDRSLLRPYMSMRNLSDPFCESVDLDNEDSRQSVDVAVFSAMEMWWGWQYTGFKGMYKAGDRFAWQNPDTGKRYQWNILVGDMNTYRGDIGAALSSHNDKDGMLSPLVDQGETIYVPPGIRVYASDWETEGSWTGGDQRGLQDYNFGYDDGSVLRVSNVPSVSRSGTTTSEQTVVIEGVGTVRYNSTYSDSSGAGQAMAIAPFDWGNTDWRPYMDGSYVLLPVRQ